MQSNVIFFTFRLFCELKSGIKMITIEVRKLVK